MKVTVCRDLSDRALSYDVEPGKLSDIFTFLELGNAVALVNGKIVEPETVVSKDDIVFIRAVPKGLVAGIAIAAGVLLLAGAAYAGYEIYKMRRQMEKYKESLSSFGNSVTNIPYVKGANNVKALDRSIPYIIGKARVAPYVLSEGKSTLYGVYGNMERGIPYIAGYGPLVLRKMYSNGALVHEFTGDTPQEGSFDITSISRGFGYVAQNGLEEISDLFPFMKHTYVTLEPGDQLLKKDDPNYTDLIYVLPENTASVEIFFMFNGLIKYTSDGKEKAHTVDIDLYWSKDGGTTWVQFEPTQATVQTVNDGPVTFKRKSQFRMAAELALPYSAVSSLTIPLQIKVVCNSNAYSGAAQEDVFVQTIQSKVYEPTLSAAANNYVFLPVLDEATAEKCCCIGYSGSARNTSEEDAFSNFALILEGVARTWNGEEWSATKTPTDNPAAWLLEVLTSDIHPQSKLTDAELDLETFGELYEYCETEELTVSKVYVDGEPKEKIIQMLCDICFSTLYKNLDGKIAVATDKEKENAIAIINTQNCFSFTNKKEMAAPVDGLRVTFLNEANEYETDAYEVMRPGVTKDANSKIRALTADGITKYEQVVKYAWRLMAIESARPKVTTVEIGNEGVYYTPLSKVLVQHPSLKNGLGSAEIKNVVMSGTDIIGLDLYEPIVYDSEDANGFGMVIQCVSDTYCTPLTKAYNAGEDGLVYSVAFVTPIDTLTAPVIPHAGDILSYGYLDDGEFSTITNEMLITNMAQTERGWRLELVDYNPAIYEYGDIPVYTPHVTTKSPVNYVPATPPPATLDDVANAIQIVTTNGDPEWIPDTVSAVQAVASQNEIAISWEWAGSGIANNIKRFIVELTKNGGTDWAVIAEPNSNTAAYSFDRTVDGYPESGDLSAWRVRVKAENVYGITSVDWRTSAINTMHYKTWIMSVPSIHAKASGRSVDLQLYKENDFYGDYEFRVQISKDGANWNELGDSSLAWIDESSYKGPGEYTALIFEAYRQVLPLTGQASDTPVDTEYRYRVALYHKQTTQVTTYSTPFIVVCKPSSARDIVSGAVKNAQLATGAVTHDKIAARTIQTENLFVTARSKINTLSNADDGISGWTNGTRFADGSRFGLELVAPNHGVSSDEFTVEPNEIVEVSFGLQLVDAAGSTGNYGIYFGCTREQTFMRYVWNTTTKKWGELIPTTNAYFIENYQGSSIQFVKTFILGSNVNIKDVPAPAVSTAQVLMCLQLSVGDIKCRLRSGHNLVNNGYTWRLYQPLAVTIGQSKIVAEQIEVKTLSAINSHLGEINGDTVDYKLVMGSGGSAEEGTLLLGATTDESYLRRWKEGGIWKMAIKLASFIVDAVSSKVIGTFQVRNSADTATHLTVDNTTGATIVSGGGDASLSAGTGRLLISNPAGEHIAIDENEIMAKSNGTTPATLYLNNDGGLVKCGEDLDVVGDLSTNKALIANTFIDTGVYLNTQEGFLITTDIPVANVMAFLEFTMHAYGGGYPAMGVVQCETWISSSAILQPKYTAIGSAPPYCRIFYSNSKLCFWFPAIGNYTTMHPVLHTNGGSYKILSTTAEALPASRSWEVTANVLLPWSSINQGAGSGSDADLLDGQHGSYYAPIASPVFTGTPRLDTAAGIFPIAQIYTGSDAYFTYLPMGSYICVYDASRTNRPRNASYPVYRRDAYTRDYTFDSGDAYGVSLPGTWRCCGVSGSTSNAYSYLMRRVA